MFLSFKVLNLFLAFWPIRYRDTAWVALALHRPGA